MRRPGTRRGGRGVTKQAARTVACPRCGAPSALGPENAWRPFCSERCKTIDLGCWAAEAYRVPESDAAAPEEDLPSN
jgi:endogenous inhibitor of DNA gyrase (YacG/DUF329 family)